MGGLLKSLYICQTFLSAKSPVNVNMYYISHTFVFRVCKPVEMSLFVRSISVVSQ